MILIQMDHVNINDMISVYSSLCIVNSLRPKAVALTSLNPKVDTIELSPLN